MAPKSIDAETFWHKIFQTTNLTSRLAEIVQQDAENGAGTAQISIDAQTWAVQVKRATSIGDNYMSEVYFVKVATDEDDYSAFVKVLPSTPFLRDIAIACGVHQREMRLYKEVFPALRKIYEKAGLDANEYLQVPDLYYLCEEPNNLTLVLENCQTAGYKMADKRTGCDLAHLESALKSLANYHAASMVYLRQLAEADPTGLIDFLQEVMPIEKGLNETLKLHLQNMVQLLIITGHADVAKKLEQRTAELLSVMDREPFVPGVKGIFCITHGDFWINNMLFLYNEEKMPLKTKMVDFQVSRIMQHCYDVQYLVTTSTTLAVRKAHLSQAMHVYFEQLNTTLEKLGISLTDEGYTEDEFRAEFEKRYLKTVVIACLLIPFTLDRNLAASMNQQSSDKAGAESYIDQEGQLTEEAQNKFKEPTKAELLASNSLVCERVTDLLVEAYQDGLL